MNIKDQLWQAFTEWYPTFEIAELGFRKRCRWEPGDDLDLVHRRMVIGTLLDMKNITDMDDRQKEGNFKEERYDLEELLTEWNELRIKKQFQSMSPRSRGRPRIRKVETGTQKKGCGEFKNQDRRVVWKHISWSYGVIQNDLVRRHEYEVYEADGRFSQRRLRDEIVTTNTVMYQGRRVSVPKLVHFLKTNTWVDKIPKEKKKKYRAVVWDGGKTIHLGCFDSEEKRLGAILHYKLTHPRVKNDSEV